jgi:hypothetical protein
MTDYFSKIQKIVILSLPKDTTLKARLFHTNCTLNAHRSHTAEAKPPSPLTGKAETSVIKGLQQVLLLKLALELNYTSSPPQ